MAGRNEIRDPIQQIIDEAKRQIQPPDAPDRTSGVNSGSATYYTASPAQEVTQGGTDDDGNAVTLWPMFWNLDNWGDPNTFWGRDE